MFSSVATKLCQNTPQRTKCSTCATRARRAGFTLVELLVVIAIIGILAGLVTVAAVQALTAAKQTRIKLEADAIVAALETFKSRYDNYPPCNLNLENDQAARSKLQSFVSKAFPRYIQGNSGNAQYGQLKEDLNNAGVDTSRFDPARALVFWLSMISDDPRRPFVTSPLTTGPANPAPQPLFEFDKTRLVVNPLGNGQLTQNGTSTPTNTKSIDQQAGNVVYKPAGADGETPYVYFDYRYWKVTAPLQINNNLSKLPLYRAGSSTSLPYAVPYIQDTNKNSTVDAADDWCNADKFQLISAGLDAQYGGPPTGNAAFPEKLYPTGVGYDLSPALSDDDNTTNFCPSRTLGGEKP